MLIGSVFILIKVFYKNVFIVMRIIDLSVIVLA